MIELQRWALPVFFVLYFLIAFVWRTWQVRRRTGIDPNVLAFGDDAHGFLGRGLRRLMLVVALYVLAQAIWPATDQGLETFAWLKRDGLSVLGWSILLVSLGWLALAQTHMGAAWRIGIDAARRTELVTTGVFALSRNPIFLGMRVNLMGLFLIRPNALTLGVWLVGDVLMQMQVRLEEAHLAAQHGDQYDRYRSRVRRWL